MDVKQLLASLFSSVWLPLLIGFLGLGSVGVGVISLQSSPSQDEVVIEKSPEPQNDSVQEMETIVIDVEGAVASPGVYELAKDSRVQDAVAAAGGMAKKADRFAVAKGVNMASKLSDGMKLYIPFDGETATLTSVTSFGTGGEVAGASTGLISLNGASQSELEELSGVGPVTAKKIIDNRPYSSVDELLSKKVVGQSVFDKIKDEITVN